jgi:hypothetical protein
MKMMLQVFTARTCKETFTCSSLGLRRPRNPGEKKTNNAANGISRKPQYRQLPCK